MADTLSDALTASAATQVRLRAYQRDKWSTLHTFMGMPQKAEVEALAEAEGAGKYQVQLYAGTSFLSSKVFYIEAEPFAQAEGDGAEAPSAFRTLEALTRDTLKYAASVNERALGMASEFRKLAENADARITSLQEKLLEVSVEKAEAEADPLNDLIRSFPQLLTAVVELKRGFSVPAGKPGDVLDRL